MSNKDEALRAKDLAEVSMSKSDFSTARRIAMKAQKMDASLENITHMIMVCDVHCAVLEKSGDEFDWYKILQVEPNADDNTIKKQYRKLALLLHPDKNKLPGAESAFKSIGEAQRVLLDKDKRRLHDMKRKPFRKPAPVPSYQPQQAPATAYYTKSAFQTNMYTARNSFSTGLRPENQQKPQAQQPDFSGGLFFWTSCAYCHEKYKFQREFINKVVTCVNCVCGKNFVAFQESPPVQTTFRFPQQNTFPTQDGGKAPAQETSKAAQKQPESSARISPRKESSRAKRSGTTAAAGENMNGKRKRKKIVEFSDISSSNSSSECEEVASSGQHSRRSVRSKQQVSYNENVSDDDNKQEDAESAEESDFRKKSNGNHMFPENLPNGFNRKGKEKEDHVGSSRDSRACNAVNDLSSESGSEVEIIECSDPDFSNFEKSREERCFKAGQIWAMYDKGRMPRYYALIRTVLRKPDFMLKYTWLEAKADDHRVKQWVRKKLPVSVGKFEIVGDEEANETPAFSHVIHCRTGGAKNTVSVYPRRGETWAVFKNWDMNWSSGRRHSFNEHEYEYDFVEILSEYVEGVGINVAILRKVKGFTSVFCRIQTGGGSDESRIRHDEMLKFSHGIPSTKLTGHERNGVPVGAFELDTAALPQKIEEIEVVPASREATMSNQVHNRPSPSLEPDCVIIPSFEFHDFTAERLEGKFVNGQIWSLNCKEDGLPKNYARIQKIEWKPVFKLHIKHLELESLPRIVTKWSDKKMPVSCGNFRLKESQDETLTKVTGFSYDIKAQQHENKYTILPKTGEIWAMYKNWSKTIKVSSLNRCEYEVVEVLDDNDSYIEVMMLERVHEYISVFKEKKEGGIDVKKSIPRSEMLRFSHYVPAFRLTGEREGVLRGLVELDPTALPRNLRRS